MPSPPTRHSDPDPPQSFPLGTDPLGRTWSLDLITGHVRNVPPETPTLGEENSTVIPGDALSVDRLARILGEGGWDVGIDATTPIVHARSELGLVFACIRSDLGHHLRIFRPFRWSPDAEGWETPEQRAEGIEYLNRSTYFLRYVPGEDPLRFTAMLDLPLAAGITRAQVLDLFRRFVAELQRVLALTDVREGIE